ncbi:alkaline phosphatase D family protein [Pseudoalteromonas sp. OANN1]|uniref:alkaline phosphatase D family protein n=1 Tax=Pseudoalteromonas sp. OANN1 TaxID=2954497 RepID=UPI002096E594|nr:alkaline phosphatase D family protein [Pseudoalteromonas sp. OANN1]MCO7200858.1 alkaline phosphatase family protein [Pseudoalteromonas sp. OANN1]
MIKLKRAKLAKRKHFTCLMLFPLMMFVAMNVYANEQATLSTIRFGSCSHQDKPMPILAAINKENPELFIFLGDNIYGDTTDMDVLKKKYEKLNANAAIQELRQQSQIIAIWDDHDYGENDAGLEYSQKEASRKIMLDFWHEPANSLRRTRDSGIYTSYEYGQGNQLIRVIMPDLRWNRPALTSVSKSDYDNKRKPKNRGPYSPVPNTSMLGDQQWQWLESELKKPAAIRIFASSLQLLPEFTGWEAWANYPTDRSRLLNFITREKLGGVIIISGDTHWGEISKVVHQDYPFWEVTSSGLTEEWKQVSPNQHRVSGFTHDVNYGFIDIDWSQPDPTITIGLKDVEGKEVMSNMLTLSDIQ